MLNGLFILFGFRVVLELIDFLIILINIFLNLVYGEELCIFFLVQIFVSE